MLATRLIAIRHGETAWNVDTRIQGQLDIPLNATGQMQAERVATALKDEQITTVYSSDLLRAWETAQAIAKAKDLQVITDEGLRERGFGTFQGKTFAEIAIELPEQSMRWRKRDPVFAPEGGESLEEVSERVSAAVSRLAALHTGEQIVIVTHGGVLDALYRVATRQDLQAPRTWELGNAAINRLLWTPEGLTLVGWSDTQHLDGLSLDEAAA